MITMVAAIWVPWDLKRKQILPFWGFLHKTIWLCMLVCYYLQEGTFLLWGVTASYCCPGSLLFSIFEKKQYACALY